MCRYVITVRFSPPIYYYPHTPPRLPSSSTVVVVDVDDVSWGGDRHQSDTYYPAFRVGFCNSRHRSLRGLAGLGWTDRWMDGWRVGRLVGRSPIIQWQHKDSMEWRKSHKGRCRRGRPQALVTLTAQHRLYLYLDGVCTTDDDGFHYIIYILFATRDTKDGQWLMC